MIALQLSLESNISLSGATAIDSIDEQYEKAAFPILVTEFGMAIEDRLRQPEKAELPMFVTELGMTIDVRREQR